MELHEALRELVAAHGRSILDDATGFRGVLDDVLAEDQASTGDINLLVDAVRFDALNPLVAMIDGGADAGRAVEEAGLRLARNRGGADQAAASWAAAVLGYAVGKVPAAVVLRYRSGRPSAPGLPPPPPTGPPIASPLPQTAWPQPAAPQPSAPQPSAPQPPPAYGVPAYQQPAAFTAPPAAPRKKRTGVWVAASVAGVVLVAGGVTAVVLAAGGDDDPSAKKDPTSSESDKGPKVDVEPAAIDDRYNALSAKMTEGASGCKAEEPGAGQAEVVQCAVSAGTLRLVTYDDDASLTTARSGRLDYSAGTLTADNGATALYELDPERAGTSDPAVVYWDSKGSLQSATLTGASGASADDLVKHYKATSPRVSEPTTPANETLREFIDINMDVATCTRQRTFFTGETEESKCESGVDGVAVNVGRYRTRKELRADRKYYKNKYDEAAKKGNGGTWRFDEGEAEGAYYAYLDDGTATVYWDWNKDDCNCYGVAWNFQGNLSKLEKWWPSD